MRPDVIGKTIKILHSNNVAEKLPEDFLSAVRSTENSGVNPEPALP
jgi:hypothetical protein